MEESPAVDGRRFLDGLIQRAGEVLARMKEKLHQSGPELPLKELIQMINSVHDFVDAWEQRMLPEANSECKEEYSQLNNDDESTDDDSGDDDDDDNSGEANDSSDELETESDEKAEGTALMKDSKSDFMPEFEFTHASLDTYKPGQQGVCTISHACDDGETFYMIDQSPDTKDVTETLKTLQNIDTQLEYVPEEPTAAFGVKLDESIFRAVRNCGTLGFILLLDTGEILPYEESMELFELPPYYAKLPAFAIKCKLDSIKDEAFNGSRIEYLEAHLYRRLGFEIVDIDSTYLTVSLSPVENVPVQPKVSKIEPEPEYKISMDTLTQEQRDELYEESLNTTNVMKAVMGYVPQDDRRICPFYDPQIQGCFKGSHCRLQHVAKLADGWTRDRTLDKTHIRAELETPIVGTEMVLIPTCIVNVDEFYAHIPLQEFSKALVDMQQKLNDPKYVQDYRTLEYEPHFLELVFAKYIPDGQWYRARVLKYLSSEYISVFYVDYGNSAEVTDEQLRRWDDRFDYLPFQAVHCRIGNIQRIRSEHVEAIEQLRAAILDKGVKIRVLDNMSPWEVQVFDNDDNDIADFLVMTKLAKPRKPLIVDHCEENMVPG